MIRSVKLRSLAKINLDLRVLHRRADGFHELRTVFQTISLSDAIEIAFEPGRKTTLEIEDTLNIPENLILRAARMAFDAMKVTGRVEFNLRKSIPMGAGMGGGSSNAAAVLLALPVLAGKAIAFEKLLEMGAELGSDVPFFLTGGTAVAVDRGTEFYSLADIAEEPILIVAPGLHVATGAAYQVLNRSLTSPGSSRNINGFQLFVRTLVESRSARAASEFGANDFEPVVFSQYPQLHALYKRLRLVSSGATGGGVRQREVKAARSGRGSDRGRGSDAKGSGVITAPSGRGSEGDGRSLEVRGSHPDIRGESSGGGAVRMTGSGSALFALFRSTEERDLAGQKVKEDRGFQGSRIIPAKLVSRRSYQRLWHRQLGGLAVSDEAIWPPHSRYAR